MQQISLTNSDMQKALDHLSKLIELEETEDHYFNNSNSINLNENQRENPLWNQASPTAAAEQNMNGQIILQNMRRQSQESNQIQQLSQFAPTSQQKHYAYPHNHDQVSEQQYESNPRSQNFQSISSVHHNDKSSIHKNTTYSIENPDIIEQSQTDTEYLEEIKRLVFERQSQQAQQESIEKENYDSENHQIKQSKFQKRPSDENNKNARHHENSSSNSSDSSNEDSDHENENYDNVNQDQYASGQRNYTNKDIIDISERLFQEGKLREQKKSIKKLEQHFDEAFRKKEEKHGITNVNTKKIIEKKIQQGEYEPIHKRWESVLQAKANKMMEANYKKEAKQKQLEEMQLTFKPQVNMQSSQMISNRTPDQVVNGLMQWNRRKQDKLFFQQIKVNEKAVEGLTFHPKINQVSAHMMGKNESEDVVTRLYKKMEEAECKKEQMKQVEFQQKYTFKPKVNEKSAQMVQEQNFRSNMHLHHHERSLTPTLYEGSKSRRRIDNNTDAVEQSARSKTPTHNYHSYQRSLTPKLLGKKQLQQRNQQISQSNLSNNLIGQQHESNSKENRFTPPAMNDKSYNGRISNMNESNYLSQRENLSQKSQVNLKKAETTLEQSLNLTQNGYNDFRYSSSKGDRILQQNNRSVNTQHSPHRFDGNFSSILKNGYSPSINNSYTVHSPDRINQKLSTQSKNQSTMTLKQSFMSSSQQNPNATLKFNDFMQQQEIVPNKNQYNQNASSSKSPHSKGQFNPNKISRDNGNTSKMNRTDNSEVNRSKTSLAYQSNYDCCSTNPHVNVQEVEFNKKLQFLLDLLSTEEKRKYQSNVFN